MPNKHRELCWARTHTVGDLLERVKDVYRQRSRCCVYPHLSNVSFFHRLRRFRARSYLFTPTCLSFDAATLSRDFDWILLRFFFCFLSNPRTTHNIRTTNVQFPGVCCFWQIAFEINSLKIHVQLSISRAVSKLFLRLNCRLSEGKYSV